MINGEVLGDAVGIGGIGVVPAGIQLSQSNGIRPIAIELVGGHANEGGLRANLASGFEQVQGADRVGVKIIEGDSGGAVVDVEFVVSGGSPEGFGESALVPSGIALRAEEDSPLVVVHAMDVPPQLGKVDADFGAD